MAEYNIDIDLDKKCSECGQKGVSKNGLCLECYAKKIVTLGMHIEKEDLKLAKAATKDENRPALNCLLVRDDKIVAADGFILVVRKKENREGTIDRGEVQIPLNVVGMLTLGKDEHVELQDTGGDEKTANIVRGMLTVASVTFTPGQNEYPAYEGMFLQRPKKAWISVDITTLRHLLRAMPSEGILDIGITDAGSPVEFSMEDEEIGETHAMMTPMIRANEYRPNWVKAEGND